MSYQDLVRKQNHKDLQNMVIAQCEYPGQTLLVALAITLEFSSLGEALEKEKSTQPFGPSYTAASRSPMVPGAGCAVYRTLDFLKQGVAERLEAEQMMELFRQEWKEYLSGTSFEDRYQIGIAKSLNFEHFFRHHWAIWRNISIEEQKLETADAV